MPEPVKYGRKTRMSYSKIHEVAEMPNLIQIQTESYNWFVGEGLREVFADISPIKDYAGNLILEFLDHKLNTPDDPPKYNQEECKERDATYAAPLKVMVRLINKETGELKEQEVFMGDFPLMTEKGTFIYNGAERVVVSQLVRSPGPYYDMLRDKNGNKLYSAQVIPNRGAWLEYEMDSNGILYVRVDRTRKTPITAFLRALASCVVEFTVEKKEESASVVERLIAEGIIRAEDKNKVFTQAGEDGAKLPPVPGVYTLSLRKTPQEIGKILVSGPDDKDDPSYYGICEDMLRRGGNEEILALFGEEEILLKTLEKDSATFDYESGVKEIYKKLRPGDPPTMDNAKNLFDSLFFEVRRYDLAKVGRYKYNKKLGLGTRLIGLTAAEDVIGPSTGEIFVSAGEEIDRRAAQAIENAGVRSVTVYSKREGEENTLCVVIGNNFVNTRDYLDKDWEWAEDLKALGIPEKSYYPALMRVLGEGEELKKQKGEYEDYIRRSLTNSEIKGQLLPKHILKDDIIATISYMLNLSHRIGSTDDIDHLGNRRVRTVGELLQNQFRIGLARMERVVRERMTIQDVEVSTPQALMNIRPVTAAVKEFFGSSQLSQFMDQNNPLAELTNKRRLSALGPGGLSRERAGFEVRDVHHSHYGRICPIETPEGPNIGLIGSLTTYGRVNEYGFIETPYRKVDKETGVVTEQIDYLTADDEEMLIIAQANEPLDSKGKFVNKRVASRGAGGEIDLVPRELIDYMDVSPKQVVSVATDMIPFLENDDANRALMGSNMQRQAVPLLVTEAPIVGTGMEYTAARDSGVVVLAKTSGVVEYVDADTIKIRKDKTGIVVDEEKLRAEVAKLTQKNEKWEEEKTDKSAERNMLEHQLKDRTKEADDIRGKLADIDVKLERLKKPIETLKAKLKKTESEEEKAKIDAEIEAKKEKNKEKEKNFKKDIRAFTKRLEELENTEDAAVIQKKVSALTKRIKALEANIEETAAEIKTLSDKLAVAEADGALEVYDLLKFKRSNQGTCVNQRPIVKRGERVEEGEVIADGPSTDEGEVALGKNLLIGFMTWEGYNYEDAIILNEHMIMDDVLTSLHIEEYEAEARDTKLGSEEITRDIPNVGDDARRDLDEEGIVRIGAEVTSYDILVGKVTPKGETELTAEERLLRAIFGEKAREVRDTSLKVPHGETGIVVDIKTFSRENGDELSPGVNKLVRVYIATKRKISVGDKMAGRHGNKGVISRILPEEDMPFMEDGTPLQLMLNPLGVPSRMNVGQVLEVHLGLVAHKKGWYVSTPVFDGASEKDIIQLLKECDYPESGKLRLRDGRTGEYFDNPVTVGYMYMLKLHHLVDDKIHARSTGPYSLVTQQPLGGKAQFGGQRFGEMEVWALEAYGAAYTLQEILTVKSDDIVGRVKTYEAIVKGDNIPEPGIPESFKVLIKEMQSLGLDVKVLSEDDEEIELKEYIDLGVSSGIERMISTEKFTLDDDDEYYTFDDDDDEEDVDIPEDDIDVDADIIDLEEDVVEIEE
ncbi:MAG: DNA-directed RNA polymerase subunit beta [Clostridiales Family XIII bacterium]|nr:DNA-directed RNA polymerase subunit beta [Clostridiales Family XIII bacterium]